MLTFEGSQMMGKDAIMGKLRGVGPVKHEIKTMDIQPTPNQNAIIIFV